jgi:integrase
LDGPGTYYAQWSSGNRCHRRSLNTTSRAIANKKLAEVLGQYRSLDRTKSKVTFSELASGWTANVLASQDLKESSRQDRKYHLIALQRTWPGLAETPVRDISHADCLRWRAARVVSPQRLNNEIGTLKAVFAWGVKCGVLAVNPVDGLARARVPTGQVTAPSKAELARIVAYLTKRKNKDAVWFVELLAYSGMRLHEAAELRWTDIDLARGLFHVTGGSRGTKNRDARWVPLFPALRGLFARIPQVDGQPRVMRRKGHRDALREACKALGMPRYGHHDLRHYFATQAVEAGVDFKTIAGWLGHKDGGLLVARTYAHLRPEHSARMAERMVQTVDDAVDNAGRNPSCGPEAENPNSEHK